MTAVARSRLAAASPFAGADVCREAGLHLEPGRPGPMFGQDAWDFTGVVGLPVQMPRSIRRLDFAAIANPRWRLLAKELVLAFLAPHHPRVAVLAHAYRTPLTLRTCFRRLDELAQWLNWLTRRGIDSLGEVTQQDCTDYLEDRRQVRDPRYPGRPASPSGLRAAVTAVLDIAHYGELFTADRYPAGFAPWRGATASAITDSRPTGENQTQPVAQEVLQPLLAACLYLVDVLGPHIARLRQQVELREEEHPGRAGTSAARATDDVIAGALRGHQATGEPLREISSQQVKRRLSSGWATGDPLLSVSFVALAHEAGYGDFRTDQLTPQLRRQATDVLRQVGLAKRWARDEPTVARADNGQPVTWTLPLHTREAMDLAELARTAAAIVVAAVTGMRSSELMELVVGCRRPPEEIRPDLFRYRIASKIVKGKPAGGVQDEWVVTEEVLRAVALAEQLRQPGALGDPLFGRIGLTNRYQGSLRPWVNGPAGRRLGLAPIPAGPVNLRMLRRTLAIEMAYRPGGLLAAKIHLKHALVAATEGYAARPGGAQAKLLAEVNQHEQQRNLDLVLAEFRNFQNGIMPSGPGARELIESFHGIDGSLPGADPSAPKVLGSDQEIRNLLTKRARVLHLGAANYCWFADPSRALCLKLAGAPTADKPLLGLCDSGRCPQATHHPCHRPVWAEAAEKTKSLLEALGPTRKAERSRLQVDHDRATRVLAQIDATSPKG